jgi:hypothetical protein
LTFWTANLTSRCGAAGAIVATLLVTIGLAFGTALPLGADFICLAAFLTARGYAILVVA